MRRPALAVVALSTPLLGACPGDPSVPCLEDRHCNRFAGGVCHAAPSGGRWCTYPDSACPSGYRYSDLDVGDGLSGQCVAPPDARADEGVLVTYGGVGDERAVGLHPIADGVLFTGTLASDATLDGHPLTYGGGSDFVIARFDPSRRAAWLRVQNDEDHEEIAGSAVDARGDLLVAGRFAGTASFGGAPLTATGGGYDLFLAKYAGADGAHLWSVRHGTASEERPAAIALDADGDVYVAGGFTGTTNLGGADLTSAGLGDAFVAKYRGQDGALVWAIRFGGAENDTAVNVAVDGARVAVAGRFRGAIDVGGTALASQGFDDIVLAGLDAATGAPVWATRHGGASHNDASADLAAAGGSLYMTGAFAGTASFGGIIHVSQGLADIFVARYELATGALVWSRTFGGGGVEVPSRVVPSGPDLLLAGRFDTAVDFGGGPIYSAGGDDLFVATLSGADGAHVDAWRLGGTQTDEATAVALTPSGRVIVGGKFQGITYFGTIQGSSAGGTDAFVFQP